MESAHPLRGAVRFGVFEVDLGGRELRKRGVRVKLQEQPFQVLQILLLHPGDVVTREELRESIWPAEPRVASEISTIRIRLAHESLDVRSHEVGFVRAS
jgi:DNA-binding response OmpR family regulator